MSDKKSSKWAAIILIGCLSMFIAEVFAGSSQIWILDLWSLLVTFPLYLSHVLLFLNLAMRTKRTSIPQLYLWGVLFGLYESWITKVLWSGYPGSEGPILGLLGGIAFVEFIVLVFFWHPLLAFVIPVMVFESLAYSKEIDNSIDDIIFPSHVKYLNKRSIVIKTLVILVVMAPAFLSVNSGFNIITAILAGLTSVMLIYIFSKLAGNFSVNQLMLGKIGLGIVIIYLILLYSITWFIIAPEKIPTSIVPFLLIIGFYLGTGVLLYISKPVEESQFDESFDQKSLITSKDIFRLFLIFVILLIPY